MLNHLLALQQADAGFPSGGFAFSNGIEALAAAGVTLDASTLGGVIAAVLRHRWSGCDRIVLLRAWRAGDDLDRLATLDDALEAATMAPSLRRGSRRNGAALLTAHLRLATPSASALHLALDAGRLLGHLPVLQGALWRHVGLDEALAVEVSGYTVASALAAAAVRLGCLGALAAQAALRDALPLIATLSHDPVGEDEPLSGSLPWLDIACARHQSASLRLFAS